ncbi:hypothetical protein ABBQ38_010036 [Trebouxia sp. C0009 RCD-2024]
MEHRLSSSLCNKACTSFGRYREGNGVDRQGCRYRGTRVSLVTALSGKLRGSRQDNRPLQCKAYACLSQHNNLSVLQDSICLLAGPTDSGQGVVHPLDGMHLTVVYVIPVRHNRGHGFSHRAQCSLNIVIVVQYWHHLFQPHMTVANREL